eukprot:3772284-Prymnesium_polylepis.1
MEFAPPAAASRASASGRATTPRRSRRRTTRRLSMLTTSACASWCHWDVSQNCLSSQCFGCGVCVQQRIGRPACEPSVDSDVVYEDCAHSCKKTTCRVCRCKHCLGCGGPPPREKRYDGCSGTGSISFDLGGKLELSLSDWTLDILVTLEPSAGLSIAEVLPAPHYAAVPLPIATGRGTTVKMVGAPPSAEGEARPIRF